jgi:hypothetical protein
MLSTHEQRVWEDIERYYTPPTGEVAGVGGLLASQREKAVPDVDDLPVTVLSGAVLAILLVIFGEVTMGLVLGAATVLGWLLWRYCWQLAAEGSTPALPMDGEVDPAAPGTPGPVAAPGRRDAEDVPGAR